MTEWKQVKLGDICSYVCSGGTPKSNVEEYYNGGIPWLNTKEVDFNRIYETERSISQLGFDNSSAKWVEPNTIVVAMYGATAGKIGIIKNRMTTNQACCNLSINPMLADYNYVYYFLKTKYDYMLSLANGGAQQNLNAGIIKQLEIPLPELETQKRIARILSSLDDKIEVNNQINRNLEEQAKAIFKSWFVDFEPFKDGKFVDSELGRIPKGWKTGKFTDVVQILGGGTPKTSIPEYWNGMIPFFTPKDVGDSIYTFATEKNLTEEGLNNCNSRLYPENTVFVTARGTVGKLALAGVPMAMNQSCYALVGKNVSPLFVFFLALQVVETLKKIANGAVFDAIVTRDFETKSVIIPPEEAINRFVELIAPLFKMIHSNVIQNTTLVQSRDTLLPKLMSGEIEVSAIEN